jgi:hypothetical protein
MSLFDLSLKVGFILALCSFLLCFAISFQSVGLSQGLGIGDRALEEYRTQKGEELIVFSGQGFNTYDRIAIEYGWLSFLFGLIALVSAARLLIRTQRLLYLACSTVGLSSLLILYKLRQLILDKSMVEDLFFEAPRNHLLKLTVDYDWILVALTLSIILALILPSLFNSRPHH